MDKIAKYKEKARVLLIIYPENKKDEIKNIKELYDKNKKAFHKRWL